MKFHTRLQSTDFVVVPVLVPRPYKILIHEYEDEDEDEKNQIKSHAKALRLFLFFAFVLPDARFQKLLVFTGFGKVHAYILPDKTVGVATPSHISISISHRPCILPIRMGLLENL